MSHVLISIAILTLVGIRCVVYIIKYACMNICSNCIKTRKCWLFNYSRINCCVVLSIYKPCRKVLDWCKLLICDTCIAIGFADWERCREIVRIIHDHIHCHVTTIWASADDDSVCINVLMISYISINKLLEIMKENWIYTLVIHPVAAFIILHPECWALRSKYIGTSHYLLELITVKSCNLVTKCIKSWVISALSGSMKPYYKRVLSTISFWFIGSIMNCMSFSSCKLKWNICLKKLWIKCIIKINLVINSYWYNLISSLCCKSLSISKSYCQVIWVADCIVSLEEIIAKWWSLIRTIVQLYSHILRVGCLFTILVTSISINYFSLWFEFDVLGWISCWPFSKSWPVEHLLGFHYLEVLSWYRSLLYLLIKF